jgi:hypothetical protein
MLTPAARTVKERPLARAPEPVVVSRREPCELARGRWLETHR